MQLNQSGQIIQSVWDGLAQIHDGIELDAFVVMPNHAHGVIVVGDPVGAIHESPVRIARIADRRRMLLAKLVGRFKMISAKRINDLQSTQGQPVWQRNYYEHIIRDDDSLNRIRQYIADNPAQWEFDRENPVVVGSEPTGDS
jgi:putative transposase